METRRILLLTLALLGAGLCAGARGTGRLLRFDAPQQEVDTVRYDSGDQTLVYPFENVSSKTVSILEIHSTCGCFTGEVRRKVLAPGERTELVATLSPRSLYGPQKRYLTVVATDGEETVISSVGVSGYVLRDLSEGQIRYAEDLGRGLRTDTSVNPIRKDAFGDYVFSIPLYNDTDRDIRLKVYASRRLTVRVPEVIPAHTRVDLRGQFDPRGREEGSDIRKLLLLRTEDGFAAPLLLVGTLY